MNMRSGKTRAVLLTKDSAIKFGKFRIIRLFFRMLSFPFSTKRNHAIFHKEYGPFPKALWNYASVGLYANRNEFEHYTQTHDPRVAPTQRSFLGGWIVVQHRGAVVTQEELQKEYPFAHLDVDQGMLEKNEPWQFCRIGGKVVLADYGRDVTRITLRQTLLET